MQRVATRRFVQHGLKMSTPHTALRFSSTASNPKLDQENGEAPPVPHDELAFLFRPDDPWRISYLYNRQRLLDETVGAATQLKFLFWWRSQNLYLVSHIENMKIFDLCDHLNIPKEEQKAFLEKYEVSKGHWTLEWCHPNPVPFHTYEELPIICSPWEPEGEASRKC